MKIQFQPTFDDYWAFHWHVLRKQFRWLIVIAVVCCFSFAVSPFLFSKPDEERSVIERYLDSAPALIIPAIVLLSVWSSRRMAKKRWTSAPEVYEFREYDIGDEGIRFTSKSIQALNAWSLIKNVEITDKFVFAKTGQNQYFFFPVSAIPDLSEFRVLIDQKVSKAKMA